MGFQRIIRIILDLIAQLLGYLWPDKYGYLPPISNPLLLKPATTLVEQIKTGKVIDIVDHYWSFFKEFTFEIA